MVSRELSLDFAGHRLAYRVSGEGPSIVILSQYWNRETTVRARLFSVGYQVLEITPVGYGRSERVSGYSGTALPDQVLAVADRHEIERFVVLGYSAGGAMAGGVACSTSRVAGLICGGFAFDSGTPALRAQLDRRLAAGHPSRDLWAWVASFDWKSELTRLSFPRLLYWGAEDRQMAARLRRWAGQLELQGIDFLEFAGLDHGTCGSPATLENLVVPSLHQWLTDRLSSW